MVHFMKEIFQKANLMAWANFHGVMEKFMKDNGVRGKSMVLGFGRGPKVIHILENGKWEFLMVMEFIVG